MMKTIVSSANKEVIIGYGYPTILIGESINPTGKKRLAAALQNGDMKYICRMAIDQVEAGADILDVNVGTSDTDTDNERLSRVTQAIMKEVDVPLCLDSDNPKSMEIALKRYQGKPIINSVTGQEHSLNEVLPLVKEYGTAVIGMTIDDDGIPVDPERRVAIARRIIDRAEALDIPCEDIIIDCLALTIATNDKNALVALQAIHMVQNELGVNQTLGASNISYGLPNRDVINNTFLALAIEAGVTCPTLNAIKVRQAVLATDLLLGRDEYAQRYLKAYRQQQK